MNDNPRVVEIDYINHREERAIRKIVPAYLWWGSTQWHPKAQWLLRAWDVEKNVERDFAWASIQGPGGIRETIAAITTISDSDDPNAHGKVPMSRKPQVHIEGWLRANEFYEWLQFRGEREAMQEFERRGLLNGETWTPKAAP